MGSLANYDVGSVLGSGQFSVVYQAKDRRSGARVAMKKLQIFDIMSSSVRQECLREARLLESLDHPCVISVVESFMEDNDLYIALELGEHGNLQELLGTVKQQQKLLLEPLVWQYFVQISSAVEHMHSRRIMHRDIKPANIFVMADGRLKLGDLGLGRLFSSKTNNTLSTVGTPYYMAPECIKHEPYDWKADIWALGCLLYELSMLNSPFQDARSAKSLYLLWQRIESGQYPPLSPVYSEEMSALVNRMLEREQIERPDATEVYQTALQIAQRFGVVI